MFDFAQNIAEQAVPTLELQACMSYPKLMRLFLGLFLFFVVVLGGLMAGAVAAAGHFLHWDITAWTDTTAWNSRKDGETGPSAAPFSAEWQSCGTVTHVFTHFELRLSIYRFHGPAPEGVDVHGWWEDVANLDAQALPTVMKKAISQAIPEAFPVNRG